MSSEVSVVTGISDFVTTIGMICRGRFAACVGPLGLVPGSSAQVPPAAPYGRFRARHGERVAITGATGLTLERGRMAESVR
jgi:hypothetical protein